jgi:alpha-D-ribose 1-methylphosphonate 5-triphosphate synthase subunit PhnG
MTVDPDATAGRRDAMAMMALATREELETGVAPLATAAELRILKAPEVGLVMLRGRIGGDGAPFNLGEATVARCVVQLRSGEIGFGHRLGRDTHAAYAAAVLDALWQAPHSRQHVELSVLEPVRRRIAVARAAAAAATASTRVDFFTLAREQT